MLESPVDDNQITLFVQVALPLPLDSFTYRIPQHLNGIIKEGQMVAVLFGRKIKQLYGGIVISISQKPPVNFNAAYIQEIVDEQPLISAPQLRFWKWLANYYLCKLGDVMVVALPAGMRLTGETKLYFNEETLINPSELDANEQKILAFLDAQTYATPKQIQDKMEITNPLKYIRSLYEKGLLVVAEEISKNAKSKTIAWIRLLVNPKNDKELEEAFKKVQRSVAQSEVLLFLINQGTAEMEKKEVLNKTGVSSAILNALASKGIIESYFKTKSRFDLHTAENEVLLLSEPQKIALNQIHDGFQHNKTALLYAPTASGKTYLYIQLIKEALAKGKQALYLLPEIALTEQIIEKLKLFLGDEVLVTHSKFNQQERAEVWDLLRSKAVNVIVGPRSAIFSPFFDLGLVIVDEEHENSFKQHDKAPRFHGRDAAIVLANYWKANIILGSATPSIESMHAAKANKYHLVSLTNRYANSGEIIFETVNLKEQVEKNKMSEMFSFDMINSLKSTIESGKQAIVFHNRKGFVPITNCTACGWVPHCINCDIALTYYKYNNEMRCHYCGFRSQPPSTCEDCGSNKLDKEGYGTEKITEDLQKILPDANIERFDQESTKRKKAHRQIIDGFTTGEIQILVGTQLLAKGFDFEKVDFVGIVNADHLLHFPDFRSGERTFQLLTQVAGRTGRRDRDGNVMIQSYRPDHPVIDAIIKSDYEKLFETELADRFKFNYPPYSRLILLQVKDFDALTAERAARVLAQNLKAQLGHRVVGPAKPGISKINRWHIREILVRIDKKTDNLKAIKALVAESPTVLRDEKDFKKTRVIINVDPA